MSELPDNLSDMYDPNDSMYDWWDRVFGYLTPITKSKSLFPEVKMSPKKRRELKKRRKAKRRKKI